MKKVFFLLFFLSCFISEAVLAQANKNTVTVEGRLINFSNQVQVVDMSEMQYLLPPVSERMIIPDTNGNFKIQFPVASPNYFSIGRNTIYLSPDDDLKVEIDYKDPMKASFKGSGSEADLYLRGIGFPKAGSYISGGGNLMRIPQQTVDKIYKLAEARKKELNELRGISSEFRHLEKARVNADILNSLLDGEVYARFKIPKDSLQDYISAYKKITEPLIVNAKKNFTDASLMKLPVYRDIASGLLKLSGNKKDLQKTLDWYTASGLVNKMRQESDKQKLRGFTSDIDKIKTEKYRDAVLKSQSVFLKFGKGDIASDFTVIDMQGNKIPLSSLKGKVIYVDIWATWCGPCMAEMPGFETLKEKYKNNPDIAFVSLSIDDETTLWKNSVTKRNAGGIQWLINRNKLDAYNIVSIPRVLLFDKQFKVVDMNAPRPSSKELPELIDNLIK